MRLYLVRHAAVVVRPDQPPEHWHLSPEGRAAAEALAKDDGWAALAQLYCSAEPKAIATAQRITAHNALAISIEPDLGEVRRPWLADDYEDAARRYLRGEPADGWEPRDAAAQRVHTCIASISSRHGEADVGIVSHGLALTLYLSNLLSLDGDAAVELWESIGFPDYAVVDLASKQLQRPFGGHLTARSPAG